ncbi:MAG: hypothetical protein WDO06_03855 [Actinomycetota bacterium]
MRFRIISTIISVALVVTCLGSSLSATAASTAKSVKGSHGEILSATPTLMKTSGLIKVTGAHFDETVGIYLAYCVVPKKGQVPTPCGGGINKAGVGTSSYWISSNPPPYGDGLAEEFKPGGRFSKNLQVSLKIGKFDCRKVVCAVTVRADHTREGDRSVDLFVPITFSK